MELVWPAHPYLASYVDALERGWSPDNIRAEAGREELDCIRQDPDRFLKEQVDRETAGPPITLPDGSSARRLAGFGGLQLRTSVCYSSRPGSVRCTSPGDCGSRLNLVTRVSANKRLLSG